MLESPSTSKTMSSPPLVVSYGVPYYYSNSPHAPQVPPPQVPVAAPYAPGASIGAPKTSSYDVEAPPEQKYIPNGLEALSAPLNTIESYSEQKLRLLRHGFIRKVFSIVGLQLLLTFGIVAIFVLVPALKAFVQANVWSLYLAISLSFSIVIMLSCKISVFARSPGNMIGLFVFTLCEAYLVGTISSFFNVDLILTAFGGTLLLVLALTLFAFQTRYDFTSWGPYLLVTLFSLLIFGMFAAIFPSRIMTLLYCMIGMVIFSFYLVYDTQKLIGTKNFSESYHIDDYVNAALEIYLDIINLFLYLLRLLGAINNSN
jgi:protein lifeguard